MKTASWVIVRKADNAPLFETFQQSVADKINLEKYRSVPILEYLQGLNSKAA